MSSLMNGGNGCPDPWLSVSSDRFYSFAAICMGLVLFGGVMSGLQQGMMQIDTPDLASLDEKPGGSRYFKSMRELLRPLIRQRHLTLVTLLVSNAMAMEALPIFMDVLVPKYFAIVMSVTLVVFFGEIIPQAICLIFPLELASIFAPLVWVLIIALLPVTYPIAALLDHLLGSEHHQMLSRAGLYELAKLHARDNKGPLTKDELDVITGTLELHEKTASDILIRLNDVFMLSYDEYIDDKKLREILNDGHSRIPIYRKERSNIVGVLLTKHLVRVNRVAIKHLQILPIWTASSDISLFAVLRKFRTGTSHMAAIYSSRDQTAGDDIDSFSRERSTSMDTERVGVTDVDQPELRAVGIITLEDVIEALLKSDIKDETDSWQPLNSSIDSKLSEVRSLRKGLISVLNHHSGSNWNGKHRGKIRPKSMGAEAFIYPSETSSLLASTSSSTPSMQHQHRQQNDEKRHETYDSLNMA